MIRVLAASAGQIVREAELTRQLAISLPTLKKYLWYAEATFIFKMIPPFFRKAKKEISKAPMPYFYDLGFLFQGLITHITPGY